MQKLNLSLSLLRKTTPEVWEVWRPLGPAESQRADESTQKVRVHSDSWRQQATFTRSDFLSVFLLEMSEVIEPPPVR